MVLVTVRDSDPLIEMKCCEIDPGTLQQQLRSLVQKVMHSVGEHCPNLFLVIQHQPNVCMRVQNRPNASLAIQHRPNVFSGIQQ